MTSAALGDALYELGERVRVARRGIGTALLALLGVLVFAAFGALGR